MVESFTASVFFPKPDPKKSKLLTCLETKLPVFSQDVSNDGSKSFFACGYEYFCNSLYSRDTMRSVYEVLQYNKPTKIYLDFDQYTHETTKEAFQNDFCNFMNTVMDVLSETFSDLSSCEIPCVILDASNEKKHSRHVIVQVTLRDVATVKEFVEFVLSKCPCKSVDTKVYTRNRSFRLLYSSKLGKSTPLTIMGHEDTSYNPDHVFYTLIQGVVPEHYQGDMKMDDTAKKVRDFFKPQQSRKRKRSGDTFSEHVATDDLPGGLITYINENGGTIRSAKKDGEFISIIVGGTYCPFIKGHHKSNNAYFTLCTKNRIGWWKCADVDCPQINYDKSNLDWVV